MCRFLRSKSRTATERLTSRPAAAKKGGDEPSHGSWREDFSHFWPILVHLEVLVMMVIQGASIRSSARRADAALPRLGALQGSLPCPLEKRLRSQELSPCLFDFACLPV